MPLRFQPRLRPLCAALALACAAGLATASPQGVVISQVYGGGGNSGATLKNDFIELFNGGTSPVSLAGWSVQYNSTTGTGTWLKTDLGHVVLQPRQYYLVQEAQGAGGTQDLPTPDAIGSIAMGSTGGKVALVSSLTPLVGDKPVSTAIVDLVGFGAANYFEGAGAAPAPSNTTADQRAADGCTDSDHNNADFAVAAPNPRNTASTLGSCGISTPPSHSIMEIQGSGATSPLVGQQVSTSGVVTRVNNNGFFLQDPLGDGDPLTSDGVFVFTGALPTVTAGQAVQLVGTVTEFNTGAASNPDTAAHTVTELTGISGLVVQASGQVIAPTVIAFPERVNDDLEQVEGMLVTLTGPLTASQNDFQGRYGQVTLSAGGRLETPTNRYRPGTAEAQDLADANARRRIILDDGTSQQNPNPTPYLGEGDTLRAGDTVAAVTGVVDYGLATSSSAGLGDYRIHPTEPVVFTRARPRTEAPPPLPGNLRLASFNVLNYFTTFTDGTDADGRSGQGCTLDGVSLPQNCRGADNLAEFQRQRAKVVAALAAINADAVGLIEMQNNGATAVQNLVDGLNAQLGAGTYAAVPDPAQGSGSDAIKVAMIYKPARLQRAAEAQSDVDAVHNRPPLAQTFEAPNGERLTLVVNHLKSKGSCPGPSDPDHDGNQDTGDGQGCWNARRVAQAQRTATWVVSLAGAAGTDAALLLGDLNAYAKEDPVVALVDSGFADQIARFNSAGYSYVFDGAAGRLDHALATPALAARLTDAAPWHINADEPSVIDYNTEFKQPQCGTCGPDLYTATAYRSSDHDPVVAGLYLVKVIGSTAGRDRLVGTPGDDQLIGGSGADKLTGGAGEDVFTYTAMSDARDTILDFMPGSDRIDLRALLASIGYSGADPIADGVVRLKDSAKGAVLQIDADGVGTAAKWTPLAVLSGVPASAVDPQRDLVFFNPAPRDRR
ncbi:ExeM/NucH family extracellular endonuclease [Ideonella sp. 4Y11]|uniref:ExeM/NucH family extracellular endonuclease n=1 Tax=Ideonella aquatica TaxID=2824119 RepID=A0A941BMI6_9BURK|nr:ExeM/NucH family extracellular endonuclease [Ideonella aquatica]MBQ0960884.1 ExeM/NucH family extracellular endonuclease [Ideonella aquatica]